MPARYDTALTEHLDYRGPALLRDAVEAVMRAAGRPMRFGSMLDLGCGTGLGGAAFRPFADWLVGVDLSPAMIAQAATKGLYDRLITASIADFLPNEIADGGKYHLVLAADVFVYVNDLAPIIADAARVLAPDGLLAFTVETHAGGGVKLLPTLRYRPRRGLCARCARHCRPDARASRQGLGAQREGRAGRQPRRGRTIRRSFPRKRESST